MPADGMKRGRAVSRVLSLFATLVLVACSIDGGRTGEAVSQARESPQVHAAAADSLPQAEGQVAVDDLAGTYEYVYEHNTVDLIENHYIILEHDGGALRGRYYGTSDDFDIGREGYLPGFFVADMEDLTVAGDSIRFTLRVSAADCFTRPVPREYRTTKDVPADQFVRWPQSLAMEPRRYRGAIQKDGIILTIERSTRPFIRTSRR